LSFEIRQGDVLARLREMPDATFGGCLTDPPYGLKFMGKAWDHGVPGPETWREVLRVLQPGAFLLAFGGTRTHHRLACAIEDAGFEIRDCIMWLYGSGFPKAKSCLKPAYEPIILARKRGPMLPLAIDACRIPGAGKLGGGQSTTGRRTASEGWMRPYMSDENAIAASITRAQKAVDTAETLGRWPANVILDSESAAALDAQSGTSNSKRGGMGGSDPGMWAGKKTTLRGGHTDSGGASRFFYCAKASPSERAGNAHPTVKPLKLTEYLARLIKPAGGGDLIVPFSGSGSEMRGAQLAGWERVVGIEQDPAYIAIARKRLSASVLKAAA
jgi:DNA modification methylase